MSPNTEDMPSRPRIRPAYVPGQKLERTERFRLHSQQSPAKKKSATPCSTPLRKPIAINNPSEFRKFRLDEAERRLLGTRGTAPAASHKPAKHRPESPPIEEKRERIEESVRRAVKTGGVDATVRESYIQSILRGLEKEPGKYRVKERSMICGYFSIKSVSFSAEIVIQLAPHFTTEMRVRYVWTPGKGGQIQMISSATRVAV